MGLHHPLSVRAQRRARAGGRSCCYPGVLLWDILFRSQLGVSVVFFEELHARNLAQLFVSRCDRSN
ncbi:MAG: hypothetical protein R3F36_00535 [Candidatus Competibacteraceae bacterium]